MPRLSPDPIDDETLQEAIETRFECTRCGHCCKGDGRVHVGPAEVDRMAEALGLPREEFLKQCALRAGRAGSEKWRLKDRFVEVAPGAPREQWCTFLIRDESGLYGCRVNAVKPDQCAGFPARWRNPDSLGSCVGLRHLLTQLRDETSETSQARPE